MAIFLFYVLVIAITHSCSGLHLRANFDQKDIRGYVQFGQHNLNSNLEILFNFTDKLRSFKNIEFTVTAGPSVYDDFCKNVGSLKYNLSATHGYINYNSKFYDNKVKMMGVDSILGSSLTLYEKQKVIACSTILPHSDVVYATANILSSSIGGFFHFLQSTKSISSNTFIYGDLKDNSNSVFNRKYNVYISADTAVHKSCGPLHQVYNPHEKSGACTTLQQSTCRIGDVRGKHGQVIIGSSRTGKLMGVDTNLPLQGSYSIVGRYVVIKSNTDVVVGCGKIHLAGPLEVVSNFHSKEHKNIAGHLKFTQQSPYHYTKFVTKLSGLGKRVKSYHVHRFPISDKRNPCSPASVGGHVNTWKVDIKKSPKPFNGSLDKYEVGDLSGRYGGLNDKNDYSYTTMDANLPLYGLHTILGRSIVIHANDGSRFVCSNIEPEKFKLKIESTANFTKAASSDLIGTVHSMEYVQVNGIRTRTITIVNLKHKDGSKTSGHKWTMQTKPVHGSSCPTRSTSSNPIYNPVRVAGSFCSEKNPFLCPIGDISGKVGFYDMKVGKSFFSDENLPMFGEMTSLGRSIVFYKKDKSNYALACANIVPNVGRSVSHLSFRLHNKKYKNELSQIHNTLLKAFDFPSSQSYRINSLTTSDVKDNDTCFRVDFSMVDTNTPPNAAYYKCGLQQIVSSNKMKPYNWCPPPRKASGFVLTPSVVLLTLTVFINCFF